MNTKYRVKTGRLHPDDAIAELSKDKHCSPKILRWLDTTGRKRYAEAQKTQEKEDIVEQLIDKMLENPLVSEVENETK